MRVIRPVSVALALLAGCAGERSVPETIRPPAPKADGSELEIAGHETWHLIGDGVTAGETVYELEVAAAADVEVIDLWIDREHAARARRAGDGFRLQADIGALAPGEHEVLLSANGRDRAFARETLIRSHPIYVVVSNDWDDADNPDATLARQERLHARHPELVLTHFVGPYTFTAPELPDARVRELTDWVTGLRDAEGDEIGLHIHPYCHFVEAAGVTCRTQPSFAFAEGDDTGYTVILASYTEDETVAMLEKADALFAEQGLGKPTSFRAGGWTADRGTLRALARTGYVADSSAANWRRLEEWEDTPGATLFQWNRDQWRSIDATSQPYFPSEADILSSEPPVIPVLEVPDNGALVDYVSAEEMIAMFDANWPGGALERSRVYSIGYHPPNFSEAFFRRMDGALAHIDRHLDAVDGGPAVYARVSDIARLRAPR